MASLRAGIIGAALVFASHAATAQSEAVPIDPQLVYATISALTKQVVNQCGEMDEIVRRLSAQVKQGHAPKAPTTEGPRAAVPAPEAPK